MSTDSRAVEARATDGAALVEYVRAKVHEPQTESYTALIEAGRPDLTVEAVVADAGAAWAGEFTDADRSAARDRLGQMVVANRKAAQAAEAQQVAHDRRIVAQVSARRIAKGLPALTRDQEDEILEQRAAKRAEGA